MFKDTGYKRLVKAPTPPLRRRPGYPGKPYPGKPGMAPYPNQPGSSTGPLTPGPESQSEYCPDMPYPGMELARAYFVIQRFGPLYDPAKALETGTLFPELYRPYPH